MLQNSGYNGFSGSIPQSFTNLKALQKVYVQGTGITGNLDLLVCAVEVEEAEANCLASTAICSCCSRCCDDTGANCT